ncbi:NUDIX hydrolase [Kineococcus xinjiangensis]|uniref:NUDIX hydrolase n=1 Tax=Kineococcus xinjiangensis TaxID=512762 RepID=UPI001B80C892|nr:NUDIX domain-containing protein [Kineococcus xinjiangensis]
MRRRASAVIVREGAVLMVREATRSSSGRHDGPSYLTLPGGGVGDDEDLDHAVRREVAEEVGLHVTSARRLGTYPYTYGETACFLVEVLDGEPRLGAHDKPCDCPKMIALEWVPLPEACSLPETPPHLADLLLALQHG